MARRLLSRRLVGLVPSPQYSPLVARAADLAVRSNPTSPMRCAAHSATTRSASNAAAARRESDAPLRPISFPRQPLPVRPNVSTASFLSNWSPPLRSFASGTVPAFNASSAPVAPTPSTPPAPSSAVAHFLTSNNGRHYALLNIPLKNKRRKIAPSVVRKRLEKLRTYVGKETNIRHSPWRLNLICQFAAGQTIPDALIQLKFCEKGKAPLVRKVVNRMARVAKSKDGLVPSQLEVAECFATHGSHLKRISYHGRGRSGKKLRRHSHMRIVVREIDFPLKIAQAKTLNQKKKWVRLQHAAEADAARAKAEREEIEELERAAAAATSAAEKDKK